MEPVELRSRASELGLTPDEWRSLQPALSDGVAAAVLAALVRYEDALVELAATPRAPADEGARG